MVYILCLCVLLEGIGDIDKKESMSGNRSASAATVFLLYHLAKLIHRNLSAPHLKQCAYYSPHHIAQEAIGLNNKSPLVVRYGFPPSLHDTAIVGSHISMEFAETGKVNIIEEPLGRLIHPFKIRRMKKAHGTMPTEGVLSRRHIVVIGARRSTKTSMRISTYRTYVLHRNICREYTIEFINQAWTIYLLLGIKVGNHLQCMYTRIGAPCAYDRCIFSE